MEISCFAWLALSGAREADFVSGWSQRCQYLDVLPDGALAWFHWHPQQHGWCDVISIGSPIWAPRSWDACCPRAAVIKRSAVRNGSVPSTSIG